MAKTFKRTRNEGARKTQKDALFVAGRWSLVVSLSFVLFGCMPGMETQGTALPFAQNAWRGQYSAEYGISKKNSPSETGRLIVSYAPSGKDKVLISMILKNGEKKAADIEAYLDKKSLQPVEVNKAAASGGERLEMKTQYQGPRVAVGILKNKKRKHLNFDSPSKVYYDNDVFLLVLQALDFEAYLKKLSETKHGKTSVALAHPQLGHVPVAEMRMAKKKDRLSLPGRTIPCYRVDISYGKMAAHRAWYMERSPHTLIQVETKDERFVLKQNNGN